MNNTNREYGFRSKNAVVTLPETSIYGMLKEHSIIFPLFQRGYSWETNNVADLVNSIMHAAKKSTTFRLNNIKNMGTIILVKNHENGKAQYVLKDLKDGSTSCGVVDGQSRLMTFNIFILAFNAYVQKNNIKCRQMTEFDMRYEEDAINDEYAKFRNDRNSASRFSKVYKYIYKAIRDNSEYIHGMKHAIENCYVADMKITSDVHIGYDLFTQTNASGRPMDAKEFIHSTLKEFSRRYNVHHAYDVNKIVALVTTYYKVKSIKVEKITNETLQRFMDAEIVRDREGLREFYAFVKKVEKFQQSNIYHAMNDLHRNRVPNLAYALIAKGYALDGSDDAVNELLLALINFSVIASYKNLNPSGPTGQHLNLLIKMIAEDKPLATVYNKLVEYVTSIFENDPVYMCNLFNGIDKVKDNIHRAIMLTDIWNNNKSADYRDVWLEHAFSQNPGLVWKLNGWTDESLIGNIGNKFLLPMKPNCDAGNKFLDEKNVIYKKAYKDNKGLETTLNTFDALKYKSDKKAYADERKQMYLEFLYDLPLGNIMIRK